jgi:hypothetical protein
MVTRQSGSLFAGVRIRHASSLMRDRGRWRLARRPARARTVPS